MCVYACVWECVSGGHAGAGGCVCLHSISPALALHFAAEAAKKQKKKKAAAPIATGKSKVCSAPATLLSCAWQRAAFVCAHFQAHLGESSSGHGHEGAAVAKPQQRA